MKRNLSKSFIAALAITAIVGSANIAHADNSSSAEYNDALSAQDAYNKAYEEFYGVGSNDSKKDEAVVEDIKENSSSQEHEDAIKAQEDYDNAYYEYYFGGDKKDDGKKDDNKEEKETPSEDPLAQVKADAIAKLKNAGITSEFYFNYVNKGKTKEGIEAYVDELIASNKASKEDKKDNKKDDKKEDKKDNKKEDKKEDKKDDKKDDGKIEEENNETGFSTKAKAEAAAKEALKKDKINKSYSISENKGKFFYVLSPEKAKDNTDKKDDEKKPSKDDKDLKVDEKATEKTFDFDKGFKTKEDAIQQAEALIANSKINKGYNVSQGADGKYYIQLTPEEEKTEGVERKPIKISDIKNAKRDSSAPARSSSNNVKTGVAGIGGVATILAAASAIYAKSKRK